MSFSICQENWTRTPRPAIVSDSITVKNQLLAITEKGWHHNFHQPQVPIIRFHETWGPLGATSKHYVVSILTSNVVDGTFQNHHSLSRSMPPDFIEQLLSCCHLWACKSRMIPLIV